jgi:hypothetical protein
MNYKALVLLTLMLSLSCQSMASPAYYTENPGSPYPPSCIMRLLQDLNLQAPHSVRFFSDRVWLEVVHKIESSNPKDNLAEVQLNLYRVACAEPNRSVIIAEFYLPPGWEDPRKRQFFLPWLEGNTGFDPYPLEFREEANSWGRNQYQIPYTSRSFGDYSGGWWDPHYYNWRYVLDVNSQGWDRDDPAKYYNDRFSFELKQGTEGNGRHIAWIDVPATEELLAPRNELPLGGRLSGTWVEEGSVDQGFLLSFGSILPSPNGIPHNRADLLVFLSWFTFDSRGDMLWLTGASRFIQGSSEVLIPIELVQDGAFLENKRAQRAYVGSAKLRSIRCNQLELTYRLDDLGLGRGTMQLQRILALEVADYACRDYEDLQASIYSPETD